jgi:diketogulonate reductase-like aldo/keto reductase
MIHRRFADTNILLPVVGQGTWGMGETPSRAGEEIAALRLGIELGMTHIDTAEMYGNGGAEELVGRAIAGIRTQIFLASKVLPSNASYSGTLKACERSLKRLGTDWLDLYLLHWWSGRHPIRETMRAMEELVRAGKVRYIGVSNLDVRQLQLAEQALTRGRIACNQVCYHMQARGIEFRLISYCHTRRIAVVGYSPFGSGKFVLVRSQGGQVLADIGARCGKSMHQVVIRFLTQRQPLFTIPKAVHTDHVRENADAVGWELAPEDLQTIDQAFPPPTGEIPLEII